MKTLIYAAPAVKGLIETEPQQAEDVDPLSAASPSLTLTVRGSTLVVRI